MSNQEYNFRCQMYVGADQSLKYFLPTEDGPRRVARFEPLPYDQLADPSFRRLLAAFDSVPQPLQIVQV